MREIKFRAWDKPINRWYSPVYEAYDGRLEELNIGINGRLSLRTMKGNIDESIFKDRFDIMQYTGLKDKNSVEVYEGDIIDNGEDTRPRVIHHGYGSNITTGLDTDPTLYNEYLRSEDIEIIGNIYENPELLKGNE